jgi:hypothetical protein
MIRRCQLLPGRIPAPRASLQEIARPSQVKETLSAIDNCL